MDILNTDKDDSYFMQQAIQQAITAFEKDEVPVGAIIVQNKNIIARAHNMSETLTDCTAHAEMIAITSAQEYLSSKYLDGCTIYVTIEPCPMCAGALHWSKIGKVVYGAADEKRGYTLFHPNILHKKTIVTQGVEAASCAQLMTSYFKNKR